MAIAAKPIKNVGNKKFIKCKNSINFTILLTSVATANEKDTLYCHNCFYNIK